MYWPRLRLTPTEKKYLGKYWDPRTGRRGVLRRMYPGHLVLSNNARLPLFNFQISRRCRVFALTVSGDVDWFRLLIETVSGERHTAEEVYLSGLLTGYTQLPPGLSGAPATSPTNQGLYPTPYVFEPNILLMPNQSLRLQGSPVTTNTLDQGDRRIDFTLHVWEFPGMPRSPR